MAISFNNIITNGLTGKIGGIVFRRWYGKTVIAKEQSPYYSSSPAQQNHRQLFQQASAYAKKVLLDTELLQFYQSRIRGGQRAYNIALADYLKPPVIEEVDTSDYQGLPGSAVLARVTDDGKVTSVRMKIERPDGSLVEEGLAVVQEDGMHWKYIVAAPHILKGCRLVIEAWDLPGRKSVRIEILKK
jgi:hypothetical protein